MTSTKQQDILRLVFKLIFYFSVVFVFCFVVLLVVGKLGTVGYVVGGLVIIAMLSISFFLYKKIDSQLAVTISQTNYTEDSAFTSLYDRSPVAYLTIKTSGEVIGGNPASVKLFRGTTDSINEVNFYNLIPIDSEVEPSILKSKVDAGVTINDIETPLQTFDGEIIWVLLSVYKHGSYEERLVSLVDVTEQKHIDTAKSEFVALATHQLRTPISAIRWNVELLRNDMKDSQTEKQTRYLTKIERNVIRMINLINDFLSVSKLEMGTFATKDEDIVLSDFFSSIVDEFIEKINEKNITINRSESSSSLTIRADSRLFHIIVSNLVSNAVKYLNPGGNLNLSFELKGDQLELVVADNGIGIPEPEVEKLFIKFYRASNAQAHQTEGTGLGLYIVKQSVERLGVL